MKATERWMHWRRSTCKYKGRRWVGWYHYPGTATVARKFGQMANPRLWDTLFPGPNESPTITFNLSGKPGSDYSGSYSGARLRTRYLGYLTAKACADSPAKKLQLSNEDGTFTSSTTTQNVGVDPGHSKIRSSSLALGNRVAITVSESVCSY